MDLLLIMTPDCFRPQLGHSFCNSKFLTSQAYILKVLMRWAYYREDKLEHPLSNFECVKSPEYTSEVEICLVLALQSRRPYRNDIENRTRLRNCLLHISCGK